MSYELFGKEELDKLARRAAQIKTADGKEAVNTTLIRENARAVSEAVSAITATVTSSDFYHQLQTEPSVAAQDLKSKLGALYTQAGQAVSTVVAEETKGLEKIAGERDTATDKVTKLTSVNAALTTENTKIAGELAAIKPKYEAAERELAAYKTREANLERFVQFVKEFKPPKIDVDKYLQ